MQAIGKVFIAPVPIIKESKMSVVMDVYTGFSFTVGADGRKVDDADEIKCDDAIKIFIASSNESTLALTVTGSVQGGKKYDLVEEIEQQSKKFPSARFDTIRNYCHHLKVRLNKIITAAKRTGSIELDDKSGESFTEIMVVGYFKGSPVFYTFSFAHEGTGIALDVSNRTSDLFNGYVYARGSRIIPELVCSGDVRFSQYRDDLCVQPQILDQDFSFRYVKAYIAACSDRAAQDVDPFCKIVGGHAHIVEINSSGYEWKIPPK